MAALCATSTIAPTMLQQGRFCGHTMIQHDTEGEILFAHTTAMKTTSSIREGNTWEAIQYLQRTKPVELAKPSENIHAFLVAYPQAQEYSG